MTKILKKNEYKPIHNDDLEYIENLRKKYESVINTLKKIKNERIAHMDMRAIEISFITKEVAELIEAIQRILNKLSGRFASFETNWSRLKDDAINQTKLLLENLEKGQEQRMKEIKEKYSIPS